MSNYADGFSKGFIVGAIVCFFVLYAIALYSTEKPSYEYVDIDNMTCIEINGDFVSCNWNEWKNKLD